MTLVKTSLLNGIAVGVKMLTLLGLNKILAVYVGPAGYAALGQFQNAVQIISTLASGGINTGVTKYTAEFHENEKLQQTIWQTAGVIALAGSVLLGVLVFIFRVELAFWFLRDASLSSVFGWFSAGLVLFVMNTLLLAILNGKKDIRRYVLANIAGSIFSLLLTSAMVVHWGLIGALIGFAIYQSLAFFVTFVLCIKTPWFRLNHFYGRIDKVVAKNLFKYTVMAVTSAATVPLIHIFIRNHLGNTLGWEAAGYWEAMSRLSGALLMLAATTLSVYYLPRLSELQTSAEIRQELLSGYRLILPAALVCALVVYQLRHFLIEKLFSSAFLPMQELFFWHLVGDILKIASWLMGIVLTAKAMMGLYVVSEVLFSLIFYLLTIQIVVMIGLEGVAVAHACVYVLHLTFMYIALKRVRLI